MRKLVVKIRLTISEKKLHLRNGYFDEETVVVFEGTVPFV
jgi:hypothetical protein